MPALAASVWMFMLPVVSLRGYLLYRKMAWCPSGLWLFIVFSGIAERTVIPGTFECILCAFFLTFCLLIFYTLFTLKNSGQKLYRTNTQTKVNKRSWDVHYMMTSCAFKTAFQLHIQSRRCVCVCVCSSRLSVFMVIVIWYKTLEHKITFSNVCLCSYMRIATLR